MLLWVLTLAAWQRSQQVTGYVYSRWWRIIPGVQYIHKCDSTLKASTEVSRGARRPIPPRPRPSSVADGTPPSQDLERRGSTGSSKEGAKNASNRALLIEGKSNDGEEWAVEEEEAADDNEECVGVSGDPLDNLSDEDYNFVANVVLGEEHNVELSRKVQEALEEEMDLTSGVRGERNHLRKPLPLKATLDLWTYFARAEFGKGNFAASMTLYEQCVDYNPVDGRAWLGMARIYWKRGDPTSAERCYKDGLYYTPKNPFLLQSWAVMLEKMGRIRRAKQLLMESVKADPTHAASWVALGKLHEREGDVDRAKISLSMAIEKDSRSYVAMQALGVIEAEEGNAARARELFEEAWKVSRRRSAHTMQAWATLERRMGNYDDALDIIARALRTAPRNSRLLLMRAEVLEASGDRARARCTYEEGQDVAEAYGDGGFFQAWALFELRSMGVIEALRESRRSIRQAEREREAQDEGGEMGMRRPRGGTGGMSFDTRSSPPRSDLSRDTHGGRVQQQQQQQQQQQEEEEGLSSVERGLSPAQRDAQRRARRIFKRAVTTNKRHSASWVAWAKFEQKSGHADVARRLLVTGIANFPESRNIAWFHCALGHLARQEGDIVTSRACYERAVEASSPTRLLPVLLEFGRMEVYHGEAMNARRLYERAVKLYPRSEEAWHDFISFERRVSPSVVSPGLAALEGRRTAALGRNDKVSIDMGVSVGDGNGEQGRSWEDGNQWAFYDPDD